MRIVKSTSQTVIELAEMVVMGGVLFYVLRPDLRTKHLGTIKAYRDAVTFWLGVQNTLQAIRNLPETDTDVTRNKGQG